MFEYIKLQRTMCFGTCPVYSVMVDNEGNVNYSGEMFVYKSGEDHWQIPMKKVEQLNGLIEDFGFKSFIYEPGNEFITDQSSCITTIKYLDGESKEINHYYGHVLIDDSLMLILVNSDHRSYSIRPSIPEISGHRSCGIRPPLSYDSANSRHLMSEV